MPDVIHFTPNITESVQIARKTAGSHTTEYVTLERLGDGSIKFTAVNGLKVYAHSNIRMDELLEAIKALN